jgi:DMSO/TMAO reductase YedYZ heme-binding membrane subunit
VNGKAYWYLTRSTGAVALVLLTIAVVLGIVQFTRWSSPRLPRFVTAGLHRNVSLLAVAFLAVHVVTAVVDSFAPIQLLDAFLPFHSRYRPLWLGFGALALDLLLALVVTSLVRARLGYRVWRAVHWLAYACWPLALVHALGTGSDDHRAWFLATTVVCAVAVTAATLWRVASTVPVLDRSRAPAFAAVALVAIALAGWTATGPLQAGWARRAGTPTSLLTSQPASLRTPASAASPSSEPNPLRVPVDSRFDGSLRETGTGSSGLDVVVIDGRFGERRADRVHVVLQGTALAGGGIEMQRSRVYLGPSSAPALYAGAVSRLDGTLVVADLRDAAGGHVELTLLLALDGGGHVTGRVRVTRGGDD